MEWEHESIEEHEFDDEFDEPDEDDISIIPEDVLLQFISELPTGYRTVFNLHTFEELSHKEIAQLLNINEKSSASQLARAKSTLAQRVNEWIKQNN
jgi:RNA polymerase sigma-70 factor (ECF subfamily)